MALLSGGACDSFESANELCVLEDECSLQVTKASFTDVSLFEAWFEYALSKRAWKFLILIVLLVPSAFYINEFT